MIFLHYFLLLCFRNLILCCMCSQLTSRLTGGGVALLYATKELDNISTSHEDEKIGVQIIKNALKVSSCADYDALLHFMHLVIPYPDVHELFRNFCRPL